MKGPDQDFPRTPFGKGTRKSSLASLANETKQHPATYRADLEAAQERRTTKRIGNVQGLPGSAPKTGQKDRFPIHTT